MTNDKGFTELIEHLLEVDRRCREDNKWLTYRVYQEIAKKHNNKIYIPFELFKLMPSFESVASIKRNLMKQGKFRHVFKPEEGVTYENPSGVGA